MRYIVALILTLLSFAAFGQAMPAVNTTPSGCGTAGLPMVSTGSAWSCGTPKGYDIIVQGRTVNLGSTGDQSTIAVPATITRYQVIGISVSNCSAIPVLAQVSLYTGAGATGTNLVAAVVITGATSSLVIVPLTLAGTVSTTILTASSIFVNVAVANATALTCDIGVRLQDWT